MRRRTWLQFGLAGAALLAVGGGLYALGHPGVADGRVTAVGRQVFRPVGQVLLAGSLPDAPAARTLALDGWLDRVDALVGSLPAHAQAELSQLLALLASAPGRRAIADLDTDWSHAAPDQVHGALQAMRTAGLLLRRQAYQALHDIAGAAYFADPAAWQVLGYPGPRDI